MIDFKINERTAQIKTDWSEVSYKEYCAIVTARDKPLHERLMLYSGLTAEEVNALTFSQANYIIGFTDFMDTWHLATVFSSGFEDAELNIGRRKYSELEQCKQAVRNKGLPVLAVGDVIKIYYGEDVSDKPVTKVLGKGLFIINAINKFLEEFAQLNEYQPTADEIEAGVEELSKFGFFATAVQLARKYGKTHDDILAMHAREVYQTLLYDYTHSEVQNNLMKIRGRRKK